MLRLRGLGQRTRPAASHASASSIASSTSSIDSSVWQSRAVRKSGWFSGIGEWMVRHARLGRARRALPPSRPHDDTATVFHATTMEVDSGPAIWCRLDHKSFGTGSLGNGGPPLMSPEESLGLVADSERLRHETLL